MKNVVICKIGLKLDKVLTKNCITLVCEENDFENLTKHIDKDQFALVDAHWGNGNLSLNYKDFIVENTGLETGNEKEKV